MYNRIKKIFFYWLPPILWMGIIFYFSSRERIEVSEKDLLNFLFFKTLHIIEYAFLYFLLLRAFYTSLGEKYSKTHLFFYVAIFSIFYAISDEVHQTFVPTREGKVRDVLIDTLGIYIMYIYIKRNFDLLKKTV